MDDDDTPDSEDRAAAASINPHLGGKDIRFLQAIQNINAREGYKLGTDDRPPATTGRIASAAELNKNEVNYRFNQRGFDAKGLGYILVYESELLPNGALSAKSAELTEKGEEALSKVLDGVPSGFTELDEDLEERLTELETEIEMLREENEELRESFQRVLESDTGAWTSERVEQFEATLNAMVAYQRIFSEVFGLDVTEFQGEEAPSDKAVSKCHDRLLESLQDPSVC